MAKGSKGRHELMSECQRPTISTECGKRCLHFHTGQLPIIQLLRDEFDLSRYHISKTIINRILPLPPSQMYSMDGSTGRVDMALSSDSTCSAHLHSPRDGFENLTMRKIRLPPPPPTVGVLAVVCFEPLKDEGSYY